MSDNQYSPCLCESVALGFQRAFQLKGQRWGLRVLGVKCFFLGEFFGVEERFVLILLGVLVLKVFLEGFLGFS